MFAFEYVSPSTKEEALEFLKGAGGETARLAGGTDLLCLMKDYVDTPGRVVNLKSIGELQGISYSESAGLRIGAVATLDELAENQQVRTQYPGLYEAVREVGGPQIRAMGTVGGNLCQRPRCWYYRLGFGLLAQLNGKSMVLEGDNRYHAVLGNDGPAYFVNPSTLAPILIALGGRVRLFGPDGDAEMPLEEFYLTPAREGEREHRLEPNQILTEVVVPPPGNRRSAVYEVRQRPTLDWALAAAGVSLELDGDTVAGARVVLGQVAPTPWPAREAESFLAGKRIDEQVAERAGELAVQGARPLSRNGYKVRLARTAVKRALLRATGKEV